MVSVHPGLVDTRMVSDFNFFGSAAFPLRSRIFLSPQEAAAAVLTVLQTAQDNKDDDVAFPAYFVNGALANDRASRLLREELVMDERSSDLSPLRTSARACFEDLISSLPSTLRHTIVERLLHAATEAEAEGQVEAEKEAEAEVGAMAAKKRRGKVIDALRMLAKTCTESGG
jgi:hypothetical protein